MITSQGVGGEESTSGERKCKLFTHQSWLGIRASGEEESIVVEEHDIVEDKKKERAQNAF
jgi:hypothetical protein